MTEDLKSMLEELKKLDEETYDDICSSFRYAEMQWPELWPEYKDEKPYIPDDVEFDDSRLLDLIQGCIQRAIEKRGWELDQNYRVKGRDGDLPKELRNYVVITNWDNDVHTYRAGGDSPASALLAAYLKASKEMK